MARIRKRGKVWNGEVRRLGYPPQSFTAPTKREVEEWAAEVERKIRARDAVVDHRRTVADLLDRFAETRSRRWDRIRLLWLSGQLGKHRLLDLTPAILEEWKTARLAVVATETVRRDLALLSSSLTYGQKILRWLPDNPVRSVKRPAPGDARERIAADEEIERVMFCGGYQLGSPPDSKIARTAAAFVFACETAMSPAEICAAKPAWRVGDVLKLPKFKTRPKREVPLSARADQIWRDVAGDFGLSPGSLDALWREKVRQRAAIAGMTFYDSRATALTRLAKVYDVLTLAKIAGHRDLNRLLTYFRPKGDDLVKPLRAADRPTA
jgi:hypothetical protein